MDTPSIGRIVTYHSRHGVDMPAIITALVTDERLKPGEDAVYLHLFPPPGAQKDNLSHEFGVPRAPEGAEDWQLYGTWRWPERT